MINPNDIRIATMFGKEKGVPTYPRLQLVKIEHIPSKITVTKGSFISQTDAKSLALVEMEELVYAWQNLKPKSQRDESFSLGIREI